MAIYDQDSAIIILRAAESGDYFISVYQWNSSPPPVVRIADVLLSAEQDAASPISFRQDHVATDKTTLISKITTYINTFFDI